MLDSGTIRFARGHTLHPLTDQDIRAKFLGCVDSSERPAAEALLSRLQGLPVQGGESLGTYLKTWSDPRRPDRSCLTIDA